MTTLVSTSEKTTWLSLHLQLCCVTSACHITSLSPGLLRVGGVVSEPAGELVCGQHFPSSLSRPSSLGPAWPLPARAAAPGTVAWHVAALGAGHWPLSGPTAWGQTK